MSSSEALNPLLPPPGGVARTPSVVEGGLRWLHTLTSDRPESGKVIT